MEVAEIHVDSPSPRTGLRSAPRVIPPRPNRPGTAWDCSGHVPKYTRGSSTSSLSAPSPRSDDRAAQISAAQCAAHIVRKPALQLQDWKSWQLLRRLALQQDISSWQKALPGSDLHARTITSVQRAIIRSATARSHLQNRLITTPSICTCVLLHHNMLPAHA